LRGTTLASSDPSLYDTRTRCPLWRVPATASQRLENVQNSGSGRRICLSNLGPANLDASIGNQPLPSRASHVLIDIPNHQHDVRAIVPQVIGNAVRNTCRSVAVDLCQVVPGKSGSLASIRACISHLVVSGLFGQDVVGSLA